MATRVDERGYNQHLVQNIDPSKCVREREKNHVLSLMCGCQNSSELVWDRNHARKFRRESEKILEMIGNMR